MILPAEMSQALLENISLRDRTTTLRNLGRGPGATAIDDKVARAKLVVDQARGFRWHSPGHLAKQDRTLAEYRNIATAIAKSQGFHVTIEDGEPSSVNDSVIFPKDSALQIELTCL